MCLCKDQQLKYSLFIIVVVPKNHIKKPGLSLKKCLAFEEIVYLYLFMHYLKSLSSTETFKKL